jgi:phosphocarrier protein HPr
MPIVKKDMVIRSKQGLHARPAAMFVQIASKYNSQITISKDDARVNGKSIMGILTLGAQHGHVISVEADGDDAEALLSEIEILLSEEPEA